MRKHFPGATVLFALVALFALTLPKARADAAGERLCLIQDELDDANAFLAAAVLAMLEPVDRVGAAAAVDGALSKVEGALEQASTTTAALELGKSSRAVIRSVAGCHRQLGKARIVIGDLSKKPGTTLKALLRASKATAKTQRTFSKVKTLGPLLILREMENRAAGLYEAGGIACFAGLALAGDGQPCGLADVTVVSVPDGVAGSATVQQGAPFLFCIPLGAVRGMAMITVSVCGVERRTYVVNRGDGTLPPVDFDVLAQVATPANLTAAGDEWLCWSDDTDAPIKIMPSAGGPIMALAARLVAPARLAVSNGTLYWMDIRDGFSPGGSVGPSVIRVLNRTGLDTPGTTQLGRGGNAASQITTDIVVVDGSVYWVIGEASPDTYTIQRIPIEGGAATDVYISPGQPITAMAADATHLYWLETAFPDSGSIRRMPLAGGPVETFYSGSAPLGGGLAIRGGQLYVADLFSGRIMALALAGGPPQDVAITTTPKRLVADDLNVYWISGTSIHAAPLTGGSESVLADGTGNLTDLCVSGDDVFWTEYGGDAHGILGTVNRVSRSGGDVTVLADGVRPPVAVAVAGDIVHWCEGGPLAQIEGYGRVAHVARGGGEVMLTLAGVSQAMPPLAADSEAVYVGDRWTLKRLSLDATSSQDLASAGFGIVSVATNGSVVAWVEGDPFGTVRCVPVTGGSVALLGMLDDYPGSIALDGTSAYVVGGLDTIHRFSLSGGGTVVRMGGLIEDLASVGGGLCFADIAVNSISWMSSSGGPARWLNGFSARDWSCRVAASGATVAWVTSSSVGQSPVSGVPGRTITTLLPSDPLMRVPNSIAATNNAIYWTAIVGDGTGFILKAPGL